MELSDEESRTLDSKLQAAAEKKLGEMLQVSQGWCTLCNPRNPRVRRGHVFFLCMLACSNVCLHKLTQHAGGMHAV